MRKLIIKSKSRGQPEVVWKVIDLKLGGMSEESFCSGSRCGDESGEKTCVINLFKGYNLHQWRNFSQKIFFHGILFLFD